MSRRHRRSPAVDSDSNRPVGDTVEQIEIRADRDDASRVAWLAVLMATMFGAYDVLLLTDSLFEGDGWRSSVMNSLGPAGGWTLGVVGTLGALLLGWVSLTHLTRPMVSTSGRELRVRTVFGLRRIDALDVRSIAIVRTTKTRSKLAISTERRRYATAAIRPSDGWRATGLAVHTWVDATVVRYG